MPKGGCTASGPAWGTAQQPPLSGSPRPLCSSPHPQPASYSSYAHALERLGTVEDTVRVVAFLLGEESGWVHGQVLRVDGGYTA